VAWRWLVSDFGSGAQRPAVRTTVMTGGKVPGSRLAAALMAASVAVAGGRAAVAS
jgi:hypothetical protein